MINAGKEKYLVSLIIPAYRQERTIKEDIVRIKDVLDQLRHDYEIIIVVDGKHDKTFDKAKEIKSSKILVVGYEHNHGKGFAVRYGMMRSRGDIIGFIDSGMDINPNGLAMLLEHFQWYNADIIVGSKRHSASRVNYPLSRKVLSFLSQMYIMFLFGLNVRDTQVGLKFFRRKVIEDILPRLLVKKFAFDIEILAVAYHLGYKRIFEAPIELQLNMTNSIVSQDLFRILFRTFWDSLAVFYRLKLLRYYDNSNKRKWGYDKELDFKANLP